MDNINDLFNLASILAGNNVSTQNVPTTQQAPANAIPAEAVPTNPVVPTTSATAVPVNENKEFNLNDMFSNPDVLKIMAQVGSGMSDPGTFGQAAGNATVNMIESNQMRKALADLTAGKQSNTNVTPAGQPGPTEVKAMPDGDIVTKATPAGATQTTQAQTASNTNVPSLSSAVREGVPDPFVMALRRSLV